MSYNLDTEAPEGFEFEAAGHKYFMRYATTEESLNMAELGDIETVKKLLELVNPVSEGAPGFKEMMLKKNQKVLKRFGEMYAKASTDEN